MGPRDETLVGGAMAAATLHHLPHELLTADALRRRWPQFVVPENWHAFFEPDSGFLLPERAISTYAELAMRQGAEIHGREPVRQWKREGASYVVRTDDASYLADRLVLCGWAVTMRLGETKVTRMWFRVSRWPEIARKSGRY